MQKEEKKRGGMLSNGRHKRNTNGRKKSQLALPDHLSSKKEGIGVSIIRGGRGGESLPTIKAGQEK